MLTMAKVKLWQEHSGDGGFANKILRPDVHGMTYDEWLLVTELITRLQLARRSDASEVFRSRTQDLLDASVSGPDVAKLLVALAESHSAFAKS